MPADFAIKTGDRLPSIRCRISSPGIEAASAVTFRMLLHGGTTSKSGTATIESTGEDLVVVRYDWGATDTDTVGVWDGEWVFTVGGKQLTLPAFPLHRPFVVVQVLDNAA